MSEESVTVFLKAQIGEFTGKMKEAGAEVESMGNKSSSNFSKFQQVGTAALMAVGVAALAVGAYGLKMADEFEQSHARLEVAVKNSGGDFDALKGKVAATDKTMENLGFTNADTESSLATLTNATHNAEKAMSLETLAADIARGRHIDLATATGILVKVETGHVSALGRLGIATKDATGATISQDEAITKLTQMYGGQASAYTDTFAGKMAVLKTKGEDLAKNIGLELIPIIEKLVSTGLSVVTFFQNVNDATGGWAGKIALIAIAAPLAVVAVLKLVSGIGTLVEILGTAGAAVASFAETIALFAMLNPEVTAVVAIGTALTAAAVALHLWGAAHDPAKQAVKEFTTAIDADTDSVGKNTNAIGDNTDALIRKQLSDRNQIDDLARLQGSLTNGQTAYKTWTDAVNGSVSAQQQLRQAMVDSGEVQIETLGRNDLSKKTVEDLTAAWIKNGGSIADNARQLRIQQPDLGLAITGNDGLVKSLDGQTTARKGAKQALDAEIASGVRNKDGTKAQTDETAKNTTVVDANTAALQARTDALNKQRDAVLAEIGADLSLQDSLQTLSTDVADYNGKSLAVLVTKGRDKTATDALNASTLQLKHGILDVVTAAVANAKALDDQAIAKGKNITADQESTAETHAAIAALKQLEVTYPALTALIQTYIDKLNQIPATKTTTVTVTNVGPTGAGYQVPGTAIVRHASGGTIGAGELGIVGDRGEELVEGLPGGGALVHTNATTKKYLANSAPMPHGGPSIIQIVVNVDVAGTSSDAAQIKKAVQQGIDESTPKIARSLQTYQRDSGRDLAQPVR